MPTVSQAHRICAKLRIYGFTHTMSGIPEVVLTEYVTNQRGDPDLKRTQVLPSLQTHLLPVRLLRV